MTLNNLIICLTQFRDSQNILNQTYDSSIDIGDTEIYYATYDHEEVVSITGDLIFYPPCFSLHAGKVILE